MPKLSELNPQDVQIESAPRLKLSEIAAEDVQIESTPPVLKLSKLTSSDLQPEVSKFETMLHGASQGLTAGLADEIAGFALASWKSLNPNEKKGFLDLYRKNQEMLESRVKSAIEQHPVLYWASDLGASVLGLGKIGTTIKGAAALGAVESVARGEAQLVGERADYKQAAMNAVLGAAAGGGTVALVKGVTKLPGAIRKQIKSPKDLTGAQEPIRKLTNEVANEMEQQAAKIDTLTSIIADKKLVRKNSELFNEQALQSFRKTLGKDEQVVNTLLESDPLYSSNLAQQLKNFTPEQQARIGLRARVDKAHKIYQKQVNDFGTWLYSPEYVTLEEAPKALANFDQKIKQGLLTPENYKEFTAQQIASKKLADQNIQLANQGFVKNYKDPLSISGKDIYSGLLDLQFAAAETDRVVGTKLGRVTNYLARQFNRMDAFKETWSRPALKLFKERRNVGLTVEQVSDALESPEIFGKLSKTQQDVITKWSSFFEDFRQNMSKQFDIEIDKIDNYLPRAGVPTPVAIARMKNKAQSINIPQLPKYQIDTLLSSVDKKLQDAYRTQYPEVYEYAKGLEYLFDTKVTSLDDIRLLTNQLDDFERIKTATGYELNAAFHRKGGIPKFLQERDAEQLMLKYIHNGAQGAYLSTPLQLLGSQVKVLKDAGMGNTAAYWDEYLKHMSGIPAPGVHAARVMADKYKAAIERTFQDGALKETLNMGPEVIHKIAESVYPNFLGLNPKANIRNSIQPFVTTAGEIGGGSYGYRLGIQAYIKTLGEIETKGIKGFSADLIERGLASPAQRLENIGNLKAGLRDSVLGVGARFIDEQAKLAMAIYIFTETVNRKVTLEMSKTVAKDLFDANARQLAGVPLKRANKIALKFINKMEPSYKNEMERLIKKGANQQTFENLIAEYLIPKTQFNYGKVGLYRYGRLMGPFLAQFTKWPTAVGSEILYKVKNDGMKGAAELSEKYLAPLITLGIIGSYTGANEYAKTPQGSEILYRKGLSDWSPVYSITTIGGPPLARTAYDAVKFTAEVAGGQIPAKDLGKRINSQLERAAKGYIPGVVWYTGFKRAEKIITNKEDKRKK